MKKTEVNALLSETDSKYIFSAISKAKVENCRIMAWRHFDNLKICADVIIRSIKNFKNEVEISPVESERENFDRIMQEAEKLNIYIPDLAVMFQTKVKSIVSATQVVLEFPKMVAQIERRRDLRLLLYSDTSSLKAGAIFYKALHSNSDQIQLFDKSCYDVSAGGLSFIVSKVESNYFRAGDVIINMRFLFGGEEVVTAGQVVSLLPVDPNEFKKLVYKGVKIGIKFLEMDPEDKRKILNFVFKNIQLNEY